jgi:hypothetical protein
MTRTHSNRAGPSNIRRPYLRLQQDTPAPLHRPPQTWSRSTGWLARPSRCRGLKSVEQDPHRLLRRHRLVTKLRTNRLRVQVLIRPVVASRAHDPLPQMWLVHDTRDARGAARRTGSAPPMHDRCAQYASTPDGCNVMLGVCCMLVRRTCVACMFEPTAAAAAQGGRTGSASRTLLSRRKRSCSAASASAPSQAHGRAETMMLRTRGRDGGLRPNLNQPRSGH